MMPRGGFNMTGALTRTGKYNPGIQRQDGCENTGRRQPCTSQEGVQKEAALSTRHTDLKLLTSRMCENKFLLFGPPDPQFVVLCFGSPNKLTQVARIFQNAK